LRDSASLRYGPRGVVAAMVAAICVWSVAYADPAGGVFPVMLRDNSCQDVASRQHMDQTADCNPDAPSWTATDRSQVQQVVVAENVDAPGAVAAATQNQDAPITQIP